MNNFFDTLRNLGPARLAAMAMVATGTLAFFIFLTSRLGTAEMALLYGELDSQDSGQIVAQLEQQQVPYRLTGDGSQIFVPSDQVARTRVAMAEQGLPSGGSMGYEIFDRSDGLGTTNFVQNINHLRALEGELARTIKSIAQVKQARVHLVLPRRELFSRERQEPSAAIVLTMRGKRRLEKSQVGAIQHMVAAAVPNLKPTMVSIVDDQGTLLARAASEDDAEGTASTAEEMRATYESRMARTIEELIERTVGPGNVRAEVSVEMDFDRITENAEIYDPDSQVVRSTQVVEESSNSLDGSGASPVTVGNNLPDANLPGLGETTTSQNNSARTEETVNYEISRTVKTHVREAGLVRRLSVAVMVNGTYQTDPEGERVYQPRSAEEMDQIAALARSAVGFDEERGDTIEVANLRFSTIETILGEPPEVSFLARYRVELMRFAEVFILGLVAILVLLFVVRPLIGRVLDGSLGSVEGAAAGMLPDPTGSQPVLAGPAGVAVAAGGVPGMAALPGQAAGAISGPIGAAPEKSAEEYERELDQMIDLNKVEGRVRASSIKKIGEIIDKHPDEAVSIVRTWMYQE